MFVKSIRGPGFAPELDRLVLDAPGTESCVTSRNEMSKRAAYMLPVKYNKTMFEYQHLLAYLLWSLDRRQGVICIF